MNRKRGGFVCISPRIGEKVIDEYYLGGSDDTTILAFEKHTRICRYCKEQLDILQVLSKLSRKGLLKNMP